MDIGAAAKALTSSLPGEDRRNSSSLGLMGRWFRSAGQGDWNDQ